MTEDILAKCQKEKEEYLAGWQRERADFLNYKKEEMERIAEILKYASEELILKILPILDNFEEAEKAIPPNEKNKFLEGVLQIKQQLKELLEKQGIEEIKVLGEAFDPNLHEAIGVIEGKDSGKIIEEVKKGYKLNGKVLRPAQVKITK
jgi:molecular chaperone GrpE